MQLNRVRPAIQLVSTLLAGALVTVPLHAQRSIMTAGTVTPVTFAVAIDRGATADRADSSRRDMSDDLLRVYGDGEWTMLWSQDGVPTASARAMIDAMTRLDERGIDATRYGVDALRSLAADRITSDGERLAFDTSMTLASIRVLRALHGGQTAGAQLARRAKVTLDTSGVYAELLSLTSISTPELVLDAAEPRYPQYSMLKAALPSYRALAGTDSIASARVAQIELTLERWRWLPGGDVATAIIVNIPEFRLHAWHTDSLGLRDTLSMDIVVGAAGAYRTPIFSDSISYLDFAPFWNVPRSLVQNELLPVARRDPHVLTMNNYQILDSRGRVLPVTAASVTLVETGKAWIRQLPGGTNALGQVKFMFPNEFDIYLHDTPVKRDFLAARRDASHGCIRVANPAALARLLLRDQASWTPAAITTAMNGRTAQRVALTKPVPVHLIYATAVARADGTVTFLEDIYGLNDALASALATPIASGQTAP